MAKHLDHQYGKISHPVARTEGNGARSPTLKGALLKNDSTNVCSGRQARAKDYFVPYARLSICVNSALSGGGGLLVFVHLAINVDTGTLNLRVGFELHQFWKTWAAPGATPKVLRILKVYTISFWNQTSLTGSGSYIIICLI